jgi:hypothetical protein
MIFIYLKYRLLIIIYADRQVLIVGIDIGAGLRGDACPDIDGGTPFFRFLARGHTNPD